METQFRLPFSKLSTCIFNLMSLFISSKHWATIFHSLSMYSLACLLLSPQRIQALWKERPHLHCSWLHSLGNHHAWYIHRCPIKQLLNKWMKQRTEELWRLWNEITIDDKMLEVKGACDLSDEPSWWDRPQGVNLSKDEVSGWNLGVLTLSAMFSIKQMIHKLGSWSDFDLLVLKWGK